MAKVTTRAILQLQLLQQQQQQLTRLGGAFVQPLPPDELLAIEGPILFRSLLPVEVQVAIASFAEAMSDLVRARRRALTCCCAHNNAATIGAAAVHVASA